MRIPRTTNVTILEYEAPPMTPSRTALWFLASDAVVLLLPDRVRIPSRRKLPGIFGLLKAPSLPKFAWFWAVSSAIERRLYTAMVGGLNPSPPISTQRRLAPARWDLCIPKCIPAKKIRHKSPRVTRMNAVHKRLKMRYLHRIAKVSQDGQKIPVLGVNDLLYQLS